jgi:AraC-like DNA-binding protein
LSTATLLLRAITTACDRRGLPTSAIVKAVGLSEAIVASPDTRVPTETYLALFAEAAKLGGEDFGISVGKALDAASFGLVGFLVASSGTLRDAFVRFSRYTRLLCDELEVTVTDRGDRVAVVYTLAVPPRVPALFEMALSHLVMSSRVGTNDAFRPEQVQFRDASGSGALTPLLGSPVKFGADEDAVVCDARSLGLPLKGANSPLLAVLESHADLLLKALPNDGEIIARCRSLVRAMLPDGEPSLDAVASRMGKGARTLQRRLREVGLTFRGVVDDVRRESALRELEAPDVSVAEVAFSLGFSDPSAFHHAFRRWTGRSPRGR